MFKSRGGLRGEGTFWTGPVALKINDIKSCEKQMKKIDAFVHTVPYTAMQCDITGLR